MRSLNNDHRVIVNFIVRLSHRCWAVGSGNTHICGDLDCSRSKNIRKIKLNIFRRDNIWSPPWQNYLPSEELKALCTSCHNRVYLRGNHLQGPRIWLLKSLSLVSAMGNSPQAIPRLTRIMP
uniref:S6K n=1 Tax=Arundo donax TaxID=35708 RepID=A0A0A9BD54_ARUDO